jgi:putative ABC transport system permease protein
MLRHLKLGLRSVGRARGFAAAVVLMLSIGIGSETAIFTILEATLLRPLPYPGSGRIVAIRQPKKELGQDWPFSYLFFQDLRDKMTAFQKLAAFDTPLFTVTGTGEPTVVDGVACSASMFKVLRIQPLLGHLFTRAEEPPGSEPVALIGWEFWRSHFHGDSSIIGSIIQLNQRPFTIIGVLPRGLNFPGLQSPPSVWVSLGADPVIGQLARSSTENRPRNRG